MKPTTLSAVLSLTCFFALPAATWAQGSHQAGAYSVDIMMNGASQPTYVSGGRSFVAGAYGSAYQIRITNHSGQRIEAVVAVDGRNVVNGQPVASRRQRGYIIQANSSTSITGFRSTTESVATFRFSSIPESYAWQTGSSWDIGAVRVWIFEEEAPPPVVYYPPVMPYGGARPQASARSAQSGASADAEASAPQSMGTAYGEQRYSPVSYTSFDRRTRRPNAVVGIRYNSYEMLVAAGIIQTAPVYPVCYGYACGGNFAPPPPGYNPNQYRW